MTKTQDSWVEVVPQYGPTRSGAKDDCNRNRLHLEFHSLFRATSFISNEKKLFHQQKVWMQLQVKWSSHSNESIKNAYCPAEVHCFAWTNQLITFLTILLFLLSLFHNFSCLKTVSVHKISCIYLVISKPLFRLVQFVCSHGDMMCNGLSELARTAFDIR